ncbi:MAG TPA: hypothetical protein VNO18_12800 [Xanthobacteraceae bacterium]|nr:hypothetical protein [Xanthobacteraceae bacterium]
MPSFGLVMFGKSEPGQYAQRSRSFRERELRRYGDFRLRVLTIPEGDQAGSLRLGEEKISSLGHAATPSD